MTETTIGAQIAADLVDFALAKEPAKRWFNWWRSSEVTECDDCHGNTSMPGEIYCQCSCCPPFPSRDVAETEAAKELAEEFAEENGKIYNEYLGAFPEGERP